MPRHVNYEQSQQTKLKLTPSKSDADPPMHGLAVLYNFDETHLFFLVTMRTSLKRKK